MIKSRKRTGKKVAKKTARYKSKKPKYKHNRIGFDGIEYQTFVRLVRERDENKCVYPGCKRRKFGLECHHILPYSKFPALRLNPANGVMLCKHHHELVTGNEMIYAPLLLKIAQENAIKQEKRTRGYNGKAGR